MEAHPSKSRALIAFALFAGTGMAHAGPGDIHNLGTLPGGSDSVGYAINASGQVAGWSVRSPDAVPHAFRYTGMPGSGGAMADLGTLTSAGFPESYGQAINASGQVAGWSGTTGDAAQHAFLYTGTPGVDGQMIDLDAWLDANNPAEGAKWTLFEAQGLSDTGWITGRGTYDPDGPGGVDASNRAFLLDASALVPEPGAIGFLTLAAGFSLLRRSRRPRFSERLAARL